MKEKYINVIKDFHPRPYGRYPTDCTTCPETCGEAFRENHLVKALKDYDRVNVDLTGYNRYGRSFLDEAFGGLISESGFQKDELDLKLNYFHSDLESVIQIIDDRIQNAQKVKENKK